MANGEIAVLEVEMLGGFSVNYRGKAVTLSRNMAAKFIQLLQIVWLHGEKGITKDALLKDLYDREELSNPNNSFNNLFYQMRRQMWKAGLPHVDYIVRNEALYTIDRKVPLKIDTAEFLKAFEKAEQALTDDEKYGSYRKAFGLYKGELLPGIAGEFWVAIEAARYKKMFEKCAVWLGEYARSRKDYQDMEYIYKKLADIYPFEDWQAFQIEAMLYKGEYKEAYALYNKTIRLYSDELGLPPTKRLLECYGKMSERIISLPGNFSEIQSGLLENQMYAPDEEGAFFCSYPSFVDVYQMLNRNIERIGNSIFLMVCTLVDYEGKMMQNGEKLKSRSDDLKEVMRICLRKGDTYTKYSASQYLLLLIGTNRENCDMVFRRIRRELKSRAGSRAEICTV